MFQSAGEPTDSREVKEANACRGCPMRATKPKGGEHGAGSEIDSANFQQVLNDVLWKRRERDSGFSMPPENWTALEYQVLILLDHEIEAVEKDLRLSQTLLLKQMFR